eukprot:5411957-Prymnesium_polylepis.1
MRALSSASDSSRASAAACDVTGGESHLVGSWVSVRLVRGSEAGRVRGAGSCHYNAKVKQSRAIQPRGESKAGRVGGVAVPHSPEVNAKQGVWGAWLSPYAPEVVGSRRATAHLVLLAARAAQLLELVLLGSDGRGSVVEGAQCLQGGVASGVDGGVDGWRGRRHGNQRGKEARQSGEGKRRGQA